MPRRTTQSHSKIRKPKHGAKEQELRKLDRMCSTAELYLQGKRQHEIAQILQISQATVVNDLARCREQWIERCSAAFDQLRSEELAKIDELERTAREAWVRSLGEQKISRRTVKVERVKIPLEKPEGKPVNRDDLKKGGGYEMVEVANEEESIVKTSSGDPRFLDQIAWCIEQRLKIFGVVKGKQTLVNNTFNFGDLLGPPPREVMDTIESKIHAPLTIQEKEESTPKPSATTSLAPLPDNSPTDESDELFNPSEIYGTEQEEESIDHDKP